jgi:hypothetical protein
MKNKKNKLLMLLEGSINQKMQLVEQYLEARANQENVKWELSNQYLVDHFEMGCRDFFGVKLNEMCFPIYDVNEPSPGFLNNFIYWFLITNVNNHSK